MGLNKLGHPLPLSLSKSKENYPQKALFLEDPSPRVDSSATDAACSWALQPNNSIYNIDEKKQCLI